MDSDDCPNCGYGDSAPGRLPEGEVPGDSGGWTRMTFPMAGADDSFEFGDTVRAISLDPECGADAIIIEGPDCPEGMLVTSKTPFTGRFTGPFVVRPFYDPTAHGAYTMVVIFWTKPRQYIPPTFIRSTVDAGYRIFSI